MVDFKKALAKKKKMLVGDRIELPHFRISQNLEGERGFDGRDEVEVVGDHDDILIVKRVRYVDVTLYVYEVPKVEKHADGFHEPHHMRTEDFNFIPGLKPEEEKPVIKPTATTAASFDGPNIKNMTFDEVARWMKEKSGK